MTFKYNLYLEVSEECMKIERLIHLEPTNLVVLPFQNNNNLEVFLLKKSNLPL